MNRLWPHTERIASLLEPDERQSVLGDIQERGATLRSLCDLTGLVILRQLQTWTSWRTWALALLLVLPAIAAGSMTHPIATIFYSGHLFSYRNAWGIHLVNPAGVLAAPIFAWALGYTLSRLGHRRSASLLLLAPTVFAWNIYRMAHTIFFDLSRPQAPYLNFLGPDDSQLARLAFLETGAFVLALVLMLLTVVLPCLRGFARGLNDRPLSPAFAIILVALILPAYVIYIPGGSWIFPRSSEVRPWFNIFAPMWPLLYTLSTARRATLNAVESR